MKKRMALIILTILFVGVLTACVQDATEKNYWELEEAFLALRGETELTMTVETMFDLQAVDGAVLHITTTQSMVDGIDEVMQTQHIRDGSGAIVSGTEIILTDTAAYVDIERQVFLPISQVKLEFAPLGLLFEEVFGTSIYDVPYTEVLGGNYTHLQILGEAVEELKDTERRRSETRTGIHGIFTEEILEDHLSRTDTDAFRIEITGESVDTYLAAVLEELNLDDPAWMFGDLRRRADVDSVLFVELGALVGELGVNFIRWVRNGDFTEANLVIERWTPDGITYYQSITLYVPDRISIEQKTTIVVGESTGIIIPTQFLTEDEVVRRIEGWALEIDTVLWNAMMSLGTVGSD